MISRQMMGGHYPTVPLGDLAEFLDHLRRPVTAADREPGPYPYFGANGEQDRVAGYLFDEPLVLLAEDGGYFGEPDKTIAYRVTGKCWVNNHAHVLRPSARIEVAYLCRHLEQYDVRSFTSGTTRLKLTKGKAEQIPIALPPLPEQKRIAAILDAADALRAKRRESIEQLDSLVQATFLEMFGDPVTNPKGWEIATLGDVCKEIRNGYAVKQTKEAAGIPISRIETISAGVINAERVGFANLQPDNVVRHLLQPGDILFSHINSTQHLCKCAIFRSEHAPMVHGMNLLRLRCNDRVAPLFLLNLIKSATYRASLMVHENRAVNQSSIAAGKLIRHPVVIPPLDLQNRFASIVESTEQQKVRLKAHLAELDTLFASLQTRAFNGELAA